MNPSPWRKHTQMAKLALVLKLPNMTLDLLFAPVGMMTEHFLFQELGVSLQVLFKFILGFAVVVPDLIVSDGIAGPDAGEVWSW